MLYRVRGNLGEVAARRVVFRRLSIGDGRIQRDGFRNAARWQAATGGDASSGRTSGDTPASGDTAHFTGPSCGFSPPNYQLSVPGNTHASVMNSGPPVPGLATWIFYVAFGSWRREMGRWILVPPDLPRTVE